MFVRVDIHGFPWEVPRAAVASHNVSGGGIANASDRSQFKNNSVTCVIVSHFNELVE